MTQLNWSELSGPRVSRRTLMKFGVATGALGFSNWLAACGGGDDDGEGDEAAAPAGDEPTTVSESDTGETGGDEATPTTGQTVSGTAAPTDTPGESGEGAGQQGGELVFGFGQEEQILTLDPAQVTQGIIAGELIANLFSSLVQFDENLGLVADLVEDWTVSEDGTGYTFNLRDGLTFHNGDSLTAEDFIYTFERTMNEEFASPHANKLNLVTDITADDDLTLSITLSEPFAPFLAVACSRGPGRALTPIPKSAIDEMGDEQFGRTPVGCGPFKMIEGTREIGTGFEMEPFEEWYGGRPLLDKVIVQIIPEPSSQISALEAGDIDMLNIVPTTGVEQIRSNDNITFVEAPGTNWSGMMMNYARPPWDNPTARMAVAKAIDRQEYVDTAFLGLAIPSHSAIAPAFGWVYHAEDDDNPQAFNLEEAKALAQEAGLEGTTAVIMATPGTERSREVIRTILSEIGVEVDVQAVQAAVNDERWQAGDFDLHINGSVVDADPDDGHWNFFHSEGPWNTYGYSNPRADELMEQTRLTNDVDERAQLWLELEQLLQEDVAYAFLSHTPDYTAFQSYVKGYRPIPEMRYLETVWLDQ